MAYKGPDDRLRNTWHNMIRRCNPNSRFKCAKYYAKKGIKVWGRWHDFEVFRRWAWSNGYNDELTIDRIDNSKGYFPSNCRWVTLQVNNQHKGDTKLSKWQVEELRCVYQLFKVPIPVLVKATGIKYGTLSSALSGKTWSNCKSIF